MNPISKTNHQIIRPHRLPHKERPDKDSYVIPFTSTFVLCLIKYLEWVRSGLSNALHFRDADRSQTFGPGWSIDSQN